MKISIQQFEEKVRSLEEIKIVIRAPSGTMVEDYDYTRKAAGNSSLTDWLEGRIKPFIGANEYSVISGEYATPHGRTKLDTLRKSYEK